MSKPGSEFEKAVFTFAKTLDPTAEVLFDHKVPDRDTGTLRQCDVWINAKFGGHWPLSILVSCKDHSRKLNINDIGTFRDEVRSTGASTGVIYSRVGFTKPAIEKAKTNSIACCRLYQNEPPDIPKSVWFEHFVCYQSAKITLGSDIHDSRYMIWDDLFDLRASEDNKTVLDIISDIFIEGGDRSVKELNEKVRGTHRELPQSWGTEITFNIHDLDSFKVQVTGFWKLYRAKTEANLLNGSYCLTDDTFKGEMISPSIHVKGSSPGDHWEQVTDKGFILPENAILALLYHPSEAKKQFREDLGPKSIR